ncbi:hypothetical protein AC578_4311 [Pseudocercospora eumusae]|uniref:Uncharacterized protein n=1 Tax=Pseudocercospora eumusae TaxID=321146 RepID=A0A139H7Y6_9PEZI|nr:hypothetical protein AC578_4311 [Pseudocercospora eumusae]
MQRLTRILVIVLFVVGTGIILLIHWSRDSQVITPAPSKEDETSVYSMGDVASQTPQGPGLSVRLAVEDGARGHVNIQISNASPDSTFTFLRWDTPFDPRALDLGVVELSDAVKGVEIPGPGLKLNRKMPAPRDELIEVEPGKTLTRKLQLKGFWLPEEGTRVNVRARGEWKAVWKARKDDVPEGELETLAGERVLRGPFQSENTVEVSI